MRFLSSSSVSIYESQTGTLSACASEFASARMRLRASSVDRSVVRASTSFMFISVSISNDFVGDIIGSVAANAAADAAISTLRTHYTGARSKGYTIDCAHPDQLRTVVNAFSRYCLKIQGKSSLLRPSVVTTLFFLLLTCTTVLPST